MTALIIPALILVMLMWGGSFVAIKIALRELTAYELVLARFLPTVVLLVIINIIKQTTNKNRKPFWYALSLSEKGLILLAGTLAVPVYHFCLNYGETIIPAGWASLVIALNPASITIMAVLILGERIIPRQIFGIMFAFAGLVYIALMNDMLADDGGIMLWYEKLWGIFITLGAVISWGAFAAISKKLIAKRDPLEVLTWSLTAGTIMALPGLRLDFFEKVFNSSWNLWHSILFLSIGCTVIAFIIWYWALANWKASRAGAFIYLVPLFALVSSQIILNEPINIHIIIGAVGVIGGVVLAGMREKRPSPQVIS